MTSWVWFLIAGLAAAAGSSLLAVDRGVQSAHQRERRRWAALRGWRFAPVDPELAQRWHHGVVAGAGLARDLVTGSLFTPLGRRLVQVFDHDQGGQVAHVVVAVQRRVREAELVVELWLPDQSFGQDLDLIMMGRVGDRVAAVNDPDQARALVTPEFSFAVNALGGDVSVAWLERDWVLAAVSCIATPARLERLLRALDEIADLLDIAAVDKTAEAVDLAALSGCADNEYRPRT